MEEQKTCPGQTESLRLRGSQGKCGYSVEDGIQEVRNTPERILEKARHPAGPTRMGLRELP